MPAFEVVAFAIVGFCKEDVNPFPFVQEYVPPPVAVKVIVPFSQTVEPLAVIIGLVFTTTFALALAEQLFPFVTKTV